MVDEPKFSDISSDVRVKVEELYMLVSGQRKLRDGCGCGVCSTKIVSSYCDGGAVCTSGIGGCDSLTAG